MLISISQEKLPILAQNAVSEKAGRTRGKPDENQNPAGRRLGISLGLGGASPAAAGPGWASLAHRGKRREIYV